MLKRVFLLIIAISLVGCGQEGKISEDDRLEVERSLISPSGKYEVVVKRPDMGIDVQKELVLIDNESSTEKIIYISEPAKLDGVWEDISFIKFLGDNDRYLEYLVTDFYSEYLVYDIETGRHLNIWISGIYDDSYFYNGLYIICSDSGLDGHEESIVAFSVEDTSKKHFIYPEDLNRQDINLNSQKEVSEWLLEHRDTAVYGGCNLQGNSFEYNLEGDTYQVNIDEIKTKLIGN